uniref:helix-turn-helix domain-containing protein n=1 Tax=Streptomyces asoensis TaxID=249586 RepID=UPI00209BEAEF|nr:helix-turn-helix domain-containing protein [Streptomyces asoensis]
MADKQVWHARALLTDPENTITSIAKLLGVSRTTVYKWCRSWRRAGTRWWRPRPGRPCPPLGDLGSVDGSGRGVVEVASQVGAATTCRRVWVLVQLLWSGDTQCC